MKRVAKKVTRDRQLNLRVADADLVRLDRLVAILSKRVDGIPITRSSVIIGSVARWLEQLEKEQP
jgi:hypothetical protein